MTRPYLFDLIGDHMPADAHHRRAWLALLRCFTRIERELMQHFAQAYNSSLPRYDVLTALVIHDGGLTMGDLATLLRVSKGNITGVVRRLKADGLVRKTTSKTDRRVQSVTISPEGRRLWEAMHDDYDRIISELLAGRTDAQVQSLTRALESTLDSINGPGD